MAFSFSDEFFGIKSFQDAGRCICKYHSDIVGYNVLVSTEWNREDEGAGTERYEIRATATHWLCRAEHGGATDDRIITKTQWDNAAPGVVWEFFRGGTL
jgi:hypothetical protein